VATTFVSILARALPADAARLFAESLAAFGDPLSPGNAWWIANTAGEVAPDVAAPALERVLKAASAPGYGEDAPAIKMTLVLGKTTIEATSTRETLLIVAGARLRAVAPDRLEKYKPVLVKWDLSGPLQIRSMAPTQPVPLPPSLATEISIIKAMGQIRAKATDRERAQVVKNLAEQINQMPAEQPRLTRIRGLANLSTEGDLGKEALTAVAKTLGETMRDVYPKMIAAKMTSSYGDGYIELAKLVRYERVPAPFADPALDAADALLSLREQIQGENGFSLTGLDGKTYSLANLKGRIVLLNFWATWCPPCRKEMPDMETLYKKYEKAGLTILAVSDEDRATVEQFLAKTSYSFPVLLDMDRKVHTSFMVEGIPKSFIFDREGRLAAQAIDMRTEAQFMDLLRLAGLE
jgi:peroxiredoxin